MKTELHGQKLSPFEQGYAAFTEGKSIEQNPFRGDIFPYSSTQWVGGWNKARRATLERKPEAKS